MARLGIRHLDELIGRTDLIKIKEKKVTRRAELVDMNRIISTEYANHEQRLYNEENSFDFKLSETVDESVLLKKFKNAIESGKAHTERIKLSSINRTVGTILGSEITARHGNSLSDDTFTLNCSGGVGQSFGAFIPKGLTMRLEGDANDYLGKGLSGGKIVVTPPQKSSFAAEDNIIIGNVSFYGATSGESYINGIAGERFMVRNSGCVCVVEGCGDHGLEYMTGGKAVILGETGKNFAAGMSGGIAYVLDEKRELYLKLNKEFVCMEELSDRQDIAELKTLVEKHYSETASPLAKRILDNFSKYLPSFKKIVPNKYNEMLERIDEFKKKGLSPEDAIMKAFTASLAH